MKSSDGGEDPPDLKKEGWLDRKGGLVFKSWQKRYFQMDGQKLQWYPSTDKKKRSGYIDIDRAKASELEISGKNSSGFVFNVEIRGKKNYMFRTQTNRDRTEWIDFINKSSDQTHQLFSAWSKDADCVNCIALAMDAPPTTMEDEKDEKEGTSGGEK